MLIVNSRKPVYRLKRRLAKVLAQNIFCLFLFSESFFFQNMQREKTALKVLYAVGLLIKSVLLCYTAA